jgi:hypothetical protein
LIARWSKPGAEALGRAPGCVIYGKKSRKTTNHVQKRLRPRVAVLYNNLLF